MATSFAYVRPSHSAAPRADIVGERPFPAMDVFGWLPARDATQHLYSGTVRRACKCLHMGEKYVYNPIPAIGA